MKSTFEEGSQQESEVEGGGLKIEEPVDQDNSEVNENALLIMMAPFAKAFNLTNEVTLLNSDLNNDERVGDDQTSTVAVLVPLMGLLLVSEIFAHVNF